MAAGKRIDRKTGEELLLCPRCRIDMKKLKRKDVVIDICRKCGGMWVDAGELEKLANLGDPKKS
ncbi:zf-TFIIB domain-containing protein [Candidatus Woesearchaeota archaeon]|nr:zf-TFIIB domain-containing protein [Candidatus Woesearchaeota archaeon]